ncbi:MAG: ankyrin repeat domain-containing protein [Chlamydiota bacterium]
MWAAINSEDRIMHMTALMHAAYGGHLGAVRLLIEKGADITHQGKEGSTALIHALRKENLSIARLLGWSGS